MLNWKKEFLYVLRYSLAGIINAVVGLGSIFLFLGIGYSPIIANALGYALALTIAFVIGKTFVYRSKGRSGPESLRYLIAFMFSFMCNIGALQISIKLFGLRPWVSQGIAIATYIVIMYFCSRVFVFSSGVDKLKN